VDLTLIKAAHGKEVIVGAQYESQPLDDERYANALEALRTSRAVERGRNDGWVLSVAMVETALESLP
jgi:hypothetical protein